MDAVSFRNTVWDLIKSIGENMEKTLRPIASEQGLTMIHARMLLDISKNGADTIGSLSKLMGMAVGNTSAMCKKLEKEGYILRTRDKEDERIVNVSLTDKGNEAINILIDVINTKYTPVFDMVDDKKIENIITGLVSLNDLINEINQQD